MFGLFSDLVFSLDRFGTAQYHIPGQPMQTGANRTMLDTYRLTERHIAAPVTVLPYNVMGPGGGAAASPSSSISEGLGNTVTARRSTRYRND